MRRTATIALSMEVTALALAVLTFGWPVLLVGAPLLVGTAAVFAAIALSAPQRRRLHDRRAARWDPDAAVPGGLMSGFFERPR